MLNINLEEVEAMEQNQQGSSKMPDFKELTDRMIANASTSPKLVIKTNLDPKTVADENPYYRQQVNDEEEFTEYFEE